MATNWADPTLSSTIHIRALHINQLRSVVNQNHRAVGLSVFPYHDSPVVSATTHFRFVHFTDLRQAIQDLWTRQGMGTLPNWSVGTAPSASRQVSARDTTDLRNWIQQYQNATGISYQPIDPVVGPFRGIHLPHGGDMRTEDLIALADFSPGAAVALMNEVYSHTQNSLSNANLFNWLVNNQNSVEIFLRYFPCPVVPRHTAGYQDYPNILTGSATYITATAAAAEMSTQVNALRSAGLTNFRIIVGNEPEREWDMNGSAQWFTSFWQDVNNYFIAIYDAFVQGNSQELYPPAFLQGAFVAVSSMDRFGNVSRQAQSATGPKTFTGADTDYGAFYVQNLIDHYLNFTSVGRLAVHSYFWPGYQANQVIDAFLPGFLLSRIQNGLPARVTEFGWVPDAITGCPSAQCCPANLDTTTTSCDGVRTGISAAGDYTDYVKNHAVLGGYHIWLLVHNQAAFSGRERCAS